MNRPSSGIELWQAALRHLTEGLINFLYPLDRIHIVRMLQDLYAVGERPDIEAFTAYAKELWPDWGKSERWVRDRWREILKNPPHRFRFMRGYEFERQPFFLLEHLAAEHGLEPIEPRLARIARAAVDSYARAATEGTRKEFDAARRELDDALSSLARLRRARFGDSFQDR